MIVSTTGCATREVLIDGSIPVPIIEKMKARVGIYYSEEFVSFRHSEVSSEIGNWNIDIGKQNFRFFKSLFNSMFADVVVLGAPEFTSELFEDVDAVLVPRVKEYGFLTPFLSGLNFYSASINYELKLYDAPDSVFLSWDVLGYGKSEGGLLGKEEAVNNATLLAIRDSGARIAIEFPALEATKNWLARGKPQEK